MKHLPECFQTITQSSHKRRQLISTSPPASSFSLLQNPLARPPQFFFYLLTNTQGKENKICPLSVLLPRPFLSTHSCTNSSAERHLSPGGLSLRAANNGARVPHYARRRSALPSELASPLPFIILPLDLKTLNLFGPSLGPSFAVSDLIWA